MILHINLFNKESPICRIRHVWSKCSTVFVITYYVSNLAAASNKLYSRKICYVYTANIEDQKISAGYCLAYALYRMCG